MTVALPIQTERLNPNQRAWVEALRSGNYLQGQRALVRLIGTGRFHCCLGVAEDVRGCQWKPISAHQYPDVRVPTHATRADAFLTDKTASWLGLESHSPAVAFFDDHDVPRELGVWRICRLYQLNDDYLYTFRQIADVIEYQPLDWTGSVGQVRKHLRGLVDAGATNVL